MNDGNGLNNNELFPARVFVLIPEESDEAIVIRRGPAETVGVFSWNLKSDEVKAHQWLKGRIYEYVSDISPNGEYLFYSANKKGEGYTVISRSPWLKAISLWRNVGGVGGVGGGLLVGNSSYMLYDGHEAYSEFVSKKLVRTERDNELLKHGVYPARLMRHGWKVKEREKRTTTFIKKIDNGWGLEKVWNVSIGKKPKGKGLFWEFHRLINGSTVIEKSGWEWCEYINNDLMWSEGGCLYKGLINANGELSEPELIHDFNLDAFEEECAPY